MNLSKIYETLGLKKPLIENDLQITAMNSLQNATHGELSYCDSDKNIKFLDTCEASAILVRENDAKRVKNHAIITQNPHLDFAILSQYFAKPLFYETHPAQISPSAKIMPNVHIGSNVFIDDNTVIMPGVYIGDNVRIGRDCILHPNVVIYNDCLIDDCCILNANCVIGSDGFGFASDKNGKHYKIYHNGRVVLGKHVEIGACTTIDRGVFDDTIIGDFSKVDNLVQIAHNCELGFGSVLVAQVGLAGSTKLGRNVVMGGQSGTTGHLKIGDFAQIAARGGVSKDLPGGKKYAGSHPILELNQWLKLQAKIQKFFSKKS